jgi:sensor histidine kinase YesM
MLDNKLIFSDRTRDRVKRHLLFWFIFWLYFGALHAGSPFGKPEISYFNNLPFTVTESIFFLLPQMVTTYPMLYFILPRFFLRKKYLPGFLVTAVIIAIGGLTSFLVINKINPFVTKAILQEEYLRNTERTDSMEFFMGLMLSFKGGLLCMSIAVAIKLVKQWYLKDYRNMLLQKENADAQLQLLNAQVHPHFLFNTLNNIYSQTQLESPKGSKMIMDLSELLRYVLYEGQKPLVPLNQELQMIQQYIELEKLRYGNKLDVHVILPEQTEELYIAPLLLLPFIENCFKHGTSNILQNPWINLSVEARNNTIVMKLMNGKSQSKASLNVHSGIGINNVKQRLKLLYHEKHELNVHDEDEVFVVDLSIDLVRIPNDVQQTTTLIPKPDQQYA